MTDKIDDGGPAFPNPYYSDVDGMSLRDWFAGMAMQIVFGEPEEIANSAYELADAMLTKRKEPANG